jgi:hypothetical protein
MREQGESYARARREILAEGDAASPSALAARPPIAHPPGEALDHRTIRFERLFPVVRRVVWRALVDGSPRLGERVTLAGAPGHVIDVDVERRLLVDLDDGAFAMVELAAPDRASCRVVSVHTLPTQAPAHPLAVVGERWHAALIDLDARLGSNPGLWSTAKKFGH